MAAAFEKLLVAAYFYTGN